MTTEEKRLNEIKGLIFIKGSSIKETMKKYGFSSYEGFKRAVKLNRKNMYEIVLKDLKT